MSLYVQYGCGLSSPPGWLNFDASPTLRLQKLPVIGRYFTSKVQFPESVRYGDILKQLPGVVEGSCDGIYCSHVLEHLSLEDFRKAIANTHKLLKKDGIFRCVVPDLAHSIDTYKERKRQNDPDASISFMYETMLGLKERPRGLKQMVISAFGNSHHLWMWDEEGLMNELNRAGFRSVRRCTFNDSEDSHFNLVEDLDRFYGALAIEARK